MGFRQPQFSFFRENLKHEDQIQDQIKQCREAFSAGDPDWEKNTVDALLLLITPKMSDKYFLAKIQDIEEGRKLAEQVKWREYKLRRSKAACPDVVPKPSPIPSSAYFKLKFMAACALFERKGLMFKAQVDAYL